MAMIMRLQEEKATKGMEARQYQTVIDEKYNYDSAEMSILKEILIRREREKYFLEKEVEAYRKIFRRNKHLDNDIYSIGDNKEEMICSCDDLVLIMQHISAFIDKKAMTETLDDFFDLPNLRLNEHDNASIQGNIPMHPSVDELHLQCSECNDKINQDFQGMPIAAINSFDEETSEAQRTNAASQITESTTSASHNSHEKVIDQENKHIYEVPIYDDCSSITTNRQFQEQNYAYSFTMKINWLTERLRIVQDGRGKLRDKSLSKNLEDHNTGPVRESQQLTKKERAACRASLPPLTSHFFASLLPITSKVCGIREIQ